MTLEKLNTAQYRPNTKNQTNTRYSEYQDANPKANPHCEVCDGSGWLYPRRADGAPDGKRIVPCPAPGCHAEFLNQGTPVIDRYGVSKDQTFENFIVNDENESAYKAAVSLASGHADFIFLTIYGITGNGKTHLANAAARKLQHEGQAVQRMTMMELLDFVQSGIYDETVPGKVKKLQLVQFLVIDELKIDHLTDSKSDFNLERFEQIINYRYDSIMPTLITTNDTPDMLPARIRSRLEDKRKSRLIWNKAADFRVKKAVKR